MQEFEGRVALVTGGTKGIGHACVRGLAEAGCAVVVTFRKDRAAALEVLRALRSLGATAEAVRLDVSKPKSAAAAVAFVQERFGRLDILVNSAGIWNENHCPLTAESEASIREMLDVNLWGAIHVARAAIPVMGMNRFGRVILIGSTAGVRGEAGHSIYAASKGALLAFARSLVPEVSKEGITVNVVAPGWIYTDMTKNALKGDALTVIESQIPTGRITRAEEVAHAVSFLASERAAQITGVRLDVNGGAVFG
ncbi:MAG TPA: SDR family oxidoreductase [Planctomycetota bacterium]|jgi:3-oxoacyl-[acyl-carrier protein] reductase|nr:SDR family oxidoreductase [Planctomycetota bacterium]